MRLDIAHESKRLADRINGTSGKSGRVSACERRVVFVHGDEVRILGLDTETAHKRMKDAPGRVVGVYVPGVTAEQIAEDLAVMA